MILHNAREALFKIFSDFSHGTTTLIECVENMILLNIPQYKRMPDFKRPCEKVEAIFMSKVSNLSREEQLDLRRALVAKLALGLPSRLESAKLPLSIRELYPNAFERLSDFLRKADHDSYNSNSEFFYKDIRFVIGLSIPGGATITDLNSRINLRSVILSGILSRRINGIIRYLRARGTGTWFRNHVDTRYLDEFTEEGHIKHYLRVAELLKVHTNIRGLTMGSWIFDPQVSKISPHHAYLIKCPLEGGAFLLKNRTHRSVIEYAIETSKTRRRLYVEGKYIPVYYSLLWPRKELIDWSEKQNPPLNEK